MRGEEWLKVLILQDLRILSVRTKVAQQHERKVLRVMQDSYYQPKD